MNRRRAEYSLRAPEHEFRPSKTQQKRESRRLRPVAVLPAAALVVGVCAGIWTATDRVAALWIYLGLLVFSGGVAAVIIVVLLPRNRRFLANAVIRVFADSIEYTDARGRVVAFDRGDSSLKALLARISTAPPGEGIRLPPSLILFVSDRTRSLGLRGADWDVDDLRIILEAVHARPLSSGRGHRARSRRPSAERDDGVLPVWDRSAAGEVLSARRVNELIPGTMSFRETRPLTFALLTAFGAVAVLAVIVVGFIVVQ